MSGDEQDLTIALEHTTARLQQELAGLLPEATITDHVGAALDEFRDARVKTYIPVLTYRLARERLQRLLG
ncbi:MAG: three-helix bundle dimerization domain-containing protein, partial [Chloroflexota bacterium]